MARVGAGPPSESLTMGGGFVFVFAKLVLGPSSPISKCPQGKCVSPLRDRLRCAKSGVSFSALGHMESEEKKQSPPHTHNNVGALPCSLFPLPSEPWVPRSKAREQDSFGYIWVGNARIPAREASRRAP